MKTKKKERKMNGRKEKEEQNCCGIGKSERQHTTTTLSRPLFALLIDGGVSRKWTLLGRLETPSKASGWTQFDFLFLSLMLVDSSCATLVQSGYGPSPLPVWSSP